MLDIYLIQTRAGYFQISQKFNSITFPPQFHILAHSATPYSSPVMATRAINKYSLYTQCPEIISARINGNGEIILKEK